MFTPLRYQASEADCYPTSVLNALVWLFERHELPGAALHHIYACCLDGIEHRFGGAYTSRHASLAVADWLGEFRNGSFAVATEIVEGPNVHLRRSGRVLSWLRREGVVILDVHVTTRTTHSILALSAGPRHVDCWDPYVRGARYDYGRGSSLLETDGHAPNVRLAKAWLDSQRPRRYSLGPLAGRVAILIRRTKPRRRRSSVAETNRRAR